MQIVDSRFHHCGRGTLDVPIAVQSNKGTATIVGNTLFQNGLGSQGPDILLWARRGPAYISRNDIQTAGGGGIMVWGRGTDPLEIAFNRVYGAGAAFDQGCVEPGTEVEVPYVDAKNTAMDSYTGFSGIGVNNSMTCTPPWIWVEETQTLMSREELCGDVGFTKECTEDQATYCRCSPCDCTKDEVVCENGDGDVLEVTSWGEWCGMPPACEPGIGRIAHNDVRDHRAYLDDHPGAAIRIEGHWGHVSVRNNLLVNNKANIAIGNVELGRASFEPSPAALHIDGNAYVHGVVDPLTDTNGDGLITDLDLEYDQTGAGDGLCALNDVGSAGFRTVDHLGNAHVGEAGFASWRDALGHDPAGQLQEGLEATSTYAPATLACGRDWTGATTWPSVDVGAGGALVDFDADGVVNSQDNCPLAANASQDDTTNSGIGDACCEGQKDCFDHNLCTSDACSAGVGCPHIPFDAGCAQVERLVRLPQPSDDPIPPGGLRGTIDGDLIVVGVPKELQGTAIVGGAYVYERQADGTWPEVDKLVPSDGGQGDRFGRWLAIGGNRIMVCSHKHDGAAGEDSGAVYAFEPGPDGWVETDKLEAGPQGAKFGAAIELANDEVFIAAKGDSEGGESAGAVHVMKYENGGWEESQKLVASDSAPFWFFGRRISAFGDRLVISAVQNVYPELVGPGRVYEFIREGGQWVEKSILGPPDDLPAGGDYRFGEFLALQEDFVVVGSPAGHPASYPSYVYRYDRIGDDWTMGAQIPAPEGIYGSWGWGLDTSATAMYFGTYSDSTHAHQSGAVRVFSAAGASPVAELRPPDPDGAWFGFGAFLSLSEDRLLVLARTGIYVYEGVPW